MMNVLRFKRPVLAMAIVFIALLVGSCMSWDPGWNQPRIVAEARDPSELWERSRHQMNGADTRESLGALLSTYEAILVIDPGSRDALTSLGTYYTLMGAGYTQDAGQKAEYYTKAIRHCEMAMYLNPLFKVLVDSGESVWDASRVLTARDAAAMGYWVTAILYYFKEVVPDPLKPFYSSWLTRSRIVMERIEVVMPNWSGGANYFNLGIYYLATPKAMGGDLERAVQYFDRARAAGPDWLLTPWGRAKYLYPLTGDREAFRSDLEWLLAYDPRDSGTPYPWGVYFQRDGRALLAQIDDLF
jgi:tetratricopeptide (TPR) repeat protein